MILAGLKLVVSRHKIPSKSGYLHHRPKIAIIDNHTGSTAAQCEPGGVFKVERCRDVGCLPALKMTVF